MERRTLRDGFQVTDLKKGYIGDVNEAKLFENEACTGNVKSYIYQARFPGSCNNFILNRSAPGAHYMHSRVH